MNKLNRTILASIGILVAFLSLVYGVFLPLRKSQLFIQAMRQSNQSTSVADYMRIFNTALDFYSPVGQAESIRFLENQIGGIIAQKPPKDVSDALVAYADSVSRVGETGSYGLSYVQELMILGNIHATNFGNYKEKRDYDIALALFQKGLVLSPNRPQFLYGLFQLYMSAGEHDKVRAIGQEILSIWPNDQAMQKVISNGQQ